MTDDMNDLIRAAAGHGPPVADEPVPVDDAGRARREIAAEIGLPSRLADRLRGTSDREIAADARNLAAALQAHGVALDEPTPHHGLDGGVRQIVQSEPDFSATIREALDRRRSE